jgi:hypothetical protein
MLRNNSNKTLAFCMSDFKFPIPLLAKNEYQALPGPGTKLSAQVAGQESDEYK